MASWRHEENGEARDKNTLSVVMASDPLPTRPQLLTMHCSTELINGFTNHDLTTFQIYEIWGGVGTLDLNYNNELIYYKRISNR